MENDQIPTEYRPEKKAEHMPADSCSENGFNERNSLESRELT